MKDTAQLQIFKDFDGYSPKYHFFENSLFGQIHDSLPWEELAALLPKENAGPEGVFGTHKEHYGLRKIRVKDENREKLMVLFATMAANAVKLAKRKQEEPPPREKAA